MTKSTPTMQNEQSPSREAAIEAIRSGFMTSVSDDGSYRIEIKYPTLPALQAAHSAILALLTPPTPQPDADRGVLIRELRNPWQDNSSNDERGPLPDWASGLMQRAAAMLADATRPQPSPAIPEGMKPAPQPVEADSEEIAVVTKAILFEDSGSTEGWQDNLELGRAAVEALSRHRQKGGEA